MGTTRLACALAGYTARLGHETALVGIGECGVLGLTEPGRWLPHLDAVPCAAGAGDVVRAQSTSGGTTHPRFMYVTSSSGCALRRSRPRRTSNKPGTADPATLRAPQRCCDRLAASLRAVSRLTAPPGAWGRAMNHYGLPRI